MSDQENQNQNEEEYEEENMMNNQEDEEGQDVYAFDIQINDDSYLLVIGKTEENKILLRLIDKEDQTKPFFQNEFSLDDLRNINPIFNNKLNLLLISLTKKKKLKLISCFLKVLKKLEMKMKMKSQMIMKMRMKKISWKKLLKLSLMK